MRTGESEYLLQKSKSSSCNVIVYIDKCAPVGVQLYHFKYEYNQNKSWTIRKFAATSKQYNSCNFITLYYNQERIEQLFMHEYCLHL